MVQSRCPGCPGGPQAALAGWCSPLPADGGQQGAASWDVQLAGLQLPSRPQGTESFPGTAASSFQGPLGLGTWGHPSLGIPEAAELRGSLPKQGAEAGAGPPAATPGGVCGGTYAVQRVCGACGMSHGCQAQCPLLVPKSGTIPYKWAQIHPKTQTKEEAAKSSLAWALRDSCTGRDFTRARSISV